MEHFIDLHLGASPETTLANFVAKPVPGRLEVCVGEVVKERCGDTKFARALVGG